MSPHDLWEALAGSFVGLARSLIVVLVAFVFVLFILYGFFVPIENQRDDD